MQVSYYLKIITNCALQRQNVKLYPLSTLISVALEVFAYWYLCPKIDRTIERRKIDGYFHLSQHDFLFHNIFIDKAVNNN